VAPLLRPLFVLKPNLPLCLGTLYLSDALSGDMSDQPPPRDATTKARQGETAGVVRWMLGISVTIVIIGMVVAFLVF
jgi:hypothetical protein